MNLSAFRLRILGGALITAALAVGLLWATVTFTIFGFIPRPEAGVPDVVARACLADPAGWATVQIGDAWVRAYGPDGRASAAGEPALDVEGWRDLPVGGQAGGEQGPRWTVVTHVAEDGPCAYLTTMEGPPPELFTGIRLGVSAGMFLAMLAVGGASYAMTVAPLLRRIDRLRDSARVVGSDGFGSADDGVADALADIGAALDRSHARIDADRRELVARHEALEQYLAEIAHDLRTPIGSLLLAVQDVRAETGSASAARALGDVAYLSALVENLHHAARLRHGLDPTEGTADLREIVLRAEVRFRALGEASGVEVAAAVPDGPVRIRCTPVLAERAVANLVQNAMSHGAKHVAVALRVDGAAFRLTVADDGPGVADPADLAQRTFSASADRPRGPGLGLAITNEIARRAGLAIAYRVDGGLVVEVTGAVVG